MPIVCTLLGINVLLILIAWKHIGYTRRQQEPEALRLIVNAFNEQLVAPPLQILLYCFIQIA